MERAGPWHYDVHGLVSVTSSILLPDLDVFVEERGRAGPGDLLTIHADRGGSEPTGTVAHLTAANGVSVHIDGRRADVLVPPRLRGAPYALFTNVVEPLLAWSLSRQGYALVHAACIALDGDGVLLSAPPGGGKTSACLAALTDPAISFLGDDTVILTPDGRVLAFPKAVKLSRATLRQMDALTDLSPGTRLAQAARVAVHTRGAHAMARTVGRRTRMIDLVAAVATVVHRLVPPPRLSIVGDATDVPFLQAARVTRVLLLDRHDGGPRSERVSVAEARATLARNSAAARRESLDDSLVNVLDEHGMLRDDQIVLPPSARCERLVLDRPSAVRAHLRDSDASSTILRS